MALRIEYDTERVVRLGCFVFHKAGCEKSKSAQIIARLMANAQLSQYRNPEDEISARAEDLARLAEIAHGGCWRVDVDLSAGFVLISQRQAL